MSQPRSRKPAVPATRQSERSEEPEQQIGQILSKLPANTSPEVIELISQSFYSGPLPPPSMFHQYEATLPGIADRIMKLAENEQGIRKRDNKWILSNDTVRILGSIAVSMGLIAAGVYCGAIGQPWLGGVLGTSGAVAGIANKLLSKSK